MRALTHLSRQFNDLLAKPQAYLKGQRTPDPEPDVCPRCGATPGSFMPIALRCGPCRMSPGSLWWRAPPPEEDEPPGPSVT